MTEPPDGLDIREPRRPGAGPQPGLSLEQVASEIRSCTLCGLAQTRTNAVPGEGAAAPSIMFIGEGPGFNEDEQGRPFVGRAGKLLDELLAVVPLLRADVFITNVVKCRPPENRDPLPDEVRACWPYLEAQIQLLRPRVIATLGRHAMNRFLPDARISEAHGRPARWRDIVVFPLYHPAAALRSTALRGTLEDDMRRLPQAVLQSLALGAEPSRIDAAPDRSVEERQARPEPPGGEPGKPGEHETRQRRLF